MVVSEFKEHERKIKALIESKGHDEALSQCSALLAEQPELKAEVLRLRAYVHAHRGSYDEAIADRKTLVNEGIAMLRDYYQLGDNSLSAGHYREASQWFNEVLRRGAEQNETWFESAALLLLSYAQMRLGQLQEAEKSLDKAVAIDAECAMPVRGEGIVTHQSLREEINRNRRRTGFF
jgi:tetratricopeptide (TPR) repeat protein